MAAKTPDWKHLTTFGLLVGAVLGTLILGAILDTGQEHRAAADPELEASPANDPPPPAPKTERVPPKREPTARPTPAATRTAGGSNYLDERAEGDRMRLAASAGDWLLQIRAACDRSKIRRTVDAVGVDPRFHLLPWQNKDVACFRLCWGPFATRDDAVAGRSGLPTELRSTSDPARPRPISDLR